MTNPLSGNQWHFASCWEIVGKSAIQNHRPKMKQAPRRELSYCTRGILLGIPLQVEPRCTVAALSLLSSLTTKPCWVTPDLRERSACTYAASMGI
jgi:hypothetical protein